SLKYCGDYAKINQAITRNEAYELSDYQGKYLCILDENYPSSLRCLKQAPFILYYEGNRELLNQACIGIVGSRNIKPYGKAMAELWTNTLSKKYVIVSGLAKGIDAVAHQAALHGLSTIAVLGCGIDYVYPSENTSLYQLIKSSGCIVSEYPGKTPPLAHHFPYRNRLIAALSHSILVMQADLRSGSMITVNYALDLGKDVYCIPYRCTDLEGLGCNLLIQQGAYILLNPLDDSI
ncbi:MAG: DNA-processing protein DprA, partial [Erysipelotrichaceae bacterium]